MEQFSPTFVTISLWVLGLIGTSIVWAVSAARRKGREDAQLEKIAKLENEVMELRLSQENIATYLESRNGVTFRRT